MMIRALTFAALLTVTASNGVSLASVSPSQSFDEWLHYWLSTTDPRATVMMQMLRDELERQRAKEPELEEDGRKHHGGGVRFS